MTIQSKDIFTGKIKFRTDVYKIFLEIFVETIKFQTRRQDNMAKFPLEPPFAMLFIRVLTRTRNVFKNSFQERIVERAGIAERMSGLWRDHAYSVGGSSTYDSHRYSTLIGSPRRIVPP